MDKLALNGVSTTPRPATAWLLFLSLWAVYAATIDKRDLHFYDLHHTGAQVVAEHHRFWYREDVKPHAVGTDRFDFEGKVYPNKQPGSILAGAVAYALLRPLGADYLHSYFVTGALVTLLTSALWTAIASVLVHRLALRWTGDGRWSLLAAIGYGLGSTAWPYTGTLHHDAMAAALLFAGFYFMERRALVSGSFLGLAMTTSMLTWILSAILAAAFVLRRGETRRVRFVLGILAGLAPLFVYNYVSFHNPFGQAVVVGGHSVYLPAGLDQESLALLWEYVRLLVVYTPATVLGLAGALFLPAEHRRERNLLLVLAAAQLAFVVIVHADGACQFGPRMLLPLLPFAATGVAGLAHVRRRALAATVAVATVVVAVGVNLLGALYGTHFCPHDRWAVAHYATAARTGVGVSMPLLEALGVPRGEASRASDRDRAGWLASEARVAVTAGRLEDARQQLEVAAQLAPDLMLVHVYAANVAYLEGDLIEASAALERAVALEPDDQELRANLERLRARIGKE